MVKAFRTLLPSPDLQSFAISPGAPLWAGDNSNLDFIHRTQWRPVLPPTPRDRVSRHIVFGFVGMLTAVCPLYP